MSAVAIVGSWDTKQAEMQYLRDRLAASGVEAILIDASTIDPSETSEECDVSAAELRTHYTAEWRSLDGAGRGAKIRFMSELVRERVKELFAAEKITGIIGCGGLQNTSIITDAMQALPLGVPKVVATTIASGGRPFSSVVGRSDIVVVPALADFTGLNFVTRSTLNAACACLVGMLSARDPVDEPERPVVGVTLLGVTNVGATAAIARLEKAGFEAIGFHATGTGGPVMEDFVRRGVIHGVLDMNLHEIASEYFGGGFSFGATDRLLSLIDRGVPLVITTGGLDFVDYFINDFRAGLGGRKHVLHNGSLAHIKLTPAEARDVGAIVGRRLAAATASILMIVPTRGLRADAGLGEPLWDPGVDEALVTSIIDHADGMVAVERVDLNLNTAEFGELVADRFMTVFAAHGQQARAGR